MTYSECLNYIHSLGNFTLPATLERITSVLEKLGNPQNDFDAIHIAGTNGKGSVSVMLAKVFETAGKKCGLFISPYIIDFRERIQINGQYISESDLCRLADKVKATNVSLTEFEFITAVAFLYFSEQKIDILVCETGLGGRLDATNTITRKLAAVITKVGLDHTAILGDTIEQIASEKCGIIKDCPVVSNPCQEKAALKVIKKSAKELYLPSIKEVVKISEDTFIYNNREYTLSLKGNYQIENALTVLETLKAIKSDIPYNIIYKALASTYFPARMETVSKKPLIVIDGAHNPDGAAALAKELKKYNGEAVAIIGAMRDKDFETVLKRTLPYCKAAITVEVKNMPRAEVAENLAAAASKYCETVSAEDYKSAIKLAKEKAGDNPIFVFGSLYLAADIRKLFNF